MRAAIVGLAALGLATQAFAADLDDDFIRGSSDYVPATPSYYNWNGFYAGAQAGMGQNFTDFGSGVGSLVAFILRNTIEEDTFHPSTWTTLANQNTSSPSYGLFAGYNSQWDDVVLGVEVNYNRTNINAADTSSMERVGTIGSNSYDIAVTAHANMNITDYGTLRGRFGYVFGRFQPYGFVGVAAGRAVVTQSANVTEIVRDSTTGAVVPGLGAPPPGETLAKSKVAYPWGFAAGAGVDMMLMPNFFLRGEYEFLQFGTFNDMRANIQTVRVGAAVRF